MAETIETFVAKLQAEGVQAGQQQAQQLRQDAEKQAEQTLADTRKQAKQILADAEKRAAETLARSRTELKLASRDAALRLQETLGRALSAVLARQVGEHLQNPQFVGKLLHEVVLLYVRADIEGGEILKINVPHEMRDQLVSWALKEIGQETVDGLRPHFDLQGTLADAGFEYTVAGSTVEVTRESVVETLMDLVGPSLRETFQQAMAGDADK